MDNEFDKKWNQIIAITNKLTHSSQDLIDDQGEIKKLSRKQYQLVYTNIFQLCTQRKKDYEKIIYNKYVELITNYLHQILKDLIENNQMYKLRKLKKVWDSFKAYQNIMNKLFQYLDRFYVIQSNQMPLNKKGLMLFKKEVFDCEQQINLEKLYFQQIEKMRNTGSLKNSENLKSLIDMISELDNTLDMTEKIINKYYDKYFQICEVYYAKKRTEFASLNCFDFLKKVDNLYEFQDKLLKSTLGITKIQKLHQKFNQHFVIDYKQDLISEKEGFVVMFKNKHIEPLILAYKLYRSLLKKAYTNYISIEIKKFLQREYREITKLSLISQYPDFNKILFLKKLIKFNKQNMLILNSHFPELRHQYKLTLQKILSEKRSVYFNFVQIMLIYVNKIFQDYNYSQKKIIDQINEIMLILSCINMDSKMSFLSNYAIVLSRRLSNNNAKKNLNYQQIFLKELKQSIGEDETKTIQNLLNKYQANQDKKNTINSTLAKSNLGFLKVNIFEAEGWYYKSKFEMMFPGKMDQHKNRINKICLDINKDKKYTIDHLESRVVLTFRSRFVEIDLTMNNLQAALVYFMFNSKKIELTQKQIYLFYKKIDEKLFNDNLEQLVSSNGILIKSKDDLFKFNHQFRTKKKMINYADFVEQETKKVEEEPQMDLTMSIKAAIIRIMKHQKILKQAQVIKRVSQSLMYFKPKQQKITKHMKELCDAQYIEKNDKTGEYTYVP